MKQYKFVNLKLEGDCSSLKEMLMLETEKQGEKRGNKVLHNKRGVEREQTQNARHEVRKFN